MSNDNNNEKLVRGFSKEELAKYNGKDGQPCYVAVEGKVYDLTGSTLWQDGQHSTCEGMAICGKDLTDVIKNNAPESHEEGHFRDFTVVGELK